MRKVELLRPVGCGGLPCERQRLTHVDRHRIVSKSKVGRVGWVIGGKLSPISNSVRRYFKIQRDGKITK